MTRAARELGWRLGAYAPANAHHPSAVKGSPTIWEPCSAAEVLAATAPSTPKARDGLVPREAVPARREQDMNTLLIVVVALVLVLLGLALSVRIG